MEMRVLIRGRHIYDLDELCEKKFGKSAAEVKIRIYTPYGKIAEILSEDDEIESNEFTEVTTIAEVRDDIVLNELFGDIDEESREKVIEILTDAEYYTGDFYSDSAKEWYTGSFKAEITVKDEKEAEEIIEKLREIEGVTADYEIV